MKIKNKKEGSRGCKITRISLWILLIILIIFITMFLWVRIKTNNDPKLRSSWNNKNSIMSDLNNTRAAAEIYYESQENSYLNWCSSESFIFVRNLADKEKQIYIDCLDNNTEYVMFAPLEKDKYRNKIVIFPWQKRDFYLEKEGKYWCVDSTGFSGEMSEPTGLVSCLPPQD